ncbi:MAG TPA: acetyl-CoA carboxylase biotin carboxyl carrier protein [Gemmatimonadales bacterium]|nr:acetyl-CoA carboxylase biotin carboxyl carrier protein [Gemmatimonadales bacterium]
MTDLALLKELLALLDASSATTIEIRRGFTTYRVSREAGHGAPAWYPAPVAAPLQAAAAAAPAGEGAAAPAAAQAASRLLEVKSPMVGTFYRSPEPGAEPYVKAGSRVTTGQTLCIIEAMKIMNELESEVSGVVREVLVEDAQPVEFGQVLFRVEPSV